MTLACLTLLACTKETVTPTESSGLQKYIEDNSSLTRGENVIACAAGNNTSFMGNPTHPVAIFFYPDQTASDIRYYESSEFDIDIYDYNNYTLQSLDLEDVFNGRMKKYNRPPVSSERWGIVTYQTNGQIHISDPIRLLAGSWPTDEISQVINVTDNGTTPSFDWSGENEPGNVIYFSVVSDLSNEMISGIYTETKNWTYGDFSNVVLDVSPTPQPGASLSPMTTYNYTLMGVSDENWVHTFGTAQFTTQ